VIMIKIAIDSGTNSFALDNAPSSMSTHFIKLRVIPRVPVHMSSVLELIGLLESVSCNSSQNDLSATRQTSLVFRASCMIGGFSSALEDEVMFRFVLFSVCELLLLRLKC
jgi:hypothetical protein